MKRILAILLMLVAGANAQTIVFFGAGDNIGNSRTNFNGNFSNILSVVQAAYSNAHVVTHQASETNFLQWVSRSSDGKTNYWLACFTNGGGTGASTPQGPWTNWIAGATYGVSNAGTYNMADTNLVIFTVGTNKFMIQGTASQPTNVAWNGNSLWNIGGGGGSPYSESATAIIAPTSGTHTIAGDGAHIGGGGLNTSTGTYSTVAGGFGNAARGAYSSVGAGRTNIANGTGSRVSGGQNNRTLGTLYDTIGGGRDNLIPNTGSGYSTIGGGKDNDAVNGAYITVGGGVENYAEEDAATIAGGYLNVARGNHGFIGGGTGNQIENGGANNDGAVIAGGYYNFIAAAAEQRCTIGGGGFNYIGGATYAATIGGGHGNTNVAYEGAIPGGRINRVAGRASLAAGTMAHALHEGSFVWNDRFQGVTGSIFATSSSNQFAIRANGGVFMTRTNVVVVPVADATLIVEGNIIVTGAGHFGSNSVYVGQTHLGETQLKTIYRDTTMARWLAAGFALLLINFIRDRKRERANRKRDAELLNRIKELEARG